MHTLPGMMLMVTATWALLLAETFIFFGVVRPLAPNIHESAFSAGLKLGVVIGLLVVWGLAMFFMQKFYARRVAPKPVTLPLEPQK